MLCPAVPPPFYLSAETQLGSCCLVELFSRDGIYSPFFPCCWAWGEPPFFSFFCARWLPLICGARLFFFSGSLSSYICSLSASSSEVVRILARIYGFFAPRFFFLCWSSVSLASTSFWVGRPIATAAGLLQTSHFRFRGPSGSCSLLSFRAVAVCEVILRCDVFLQYLCSMK